MQPFFEIRARHARVSDALGAEIRRRAEKLNQFYERITSCRVMVEGPGRHHRIGLHRVIIDLTVPGSGIVITREGGPNLSLVVRETFDAAARRLQDYVQRARGYVKAHAGAREPELR